LNRYVYTLNNPLSYTDPTGNDPCTNADGSTGNDGNTSTNLVFPAPPCLEVSSLIPDLNNTDNQRKPSDITPESQPGNEGLSGGGQGGGFDNPWGNALFTPQVGGRYFGAADKLVRNATIATTAATGGAMLAPAIGSGASLATLNALGLLGPTARLFWSGVGAIGAIGAARASAGMATTLEDSPLGGVADYLQGLAPDFRNAFTGAAWNQLSTWFAQGAQTATYYEGAGGYQGNAWLNYEMPVLVQRGIPIVTVPHP